MVRWAIAAAVMVGLGEGAAAPLVPRPAEPVVYTVGFPDLAEHTAHVTMSFATGGRATDLFMAKWSPGFYREQDYAAMVSGLTVATLGGDPLEVEHPAANRWHVPAHRADGVMVTYDLHCEDRFVTTNWVGEDYAILNGPATFVGIVGELDRPCAVRIELPPSWKSSFSGMEASSPNVYSAPNFDTLVDCPIAAGNLGAQEFVVDGKTHRVVNIGDHGPWRPERAAADLEKIVRENRRMWEFLPYRDYTFLLAFRRGGGGLEHSTSTLATTSPTGMERGYEGWLGFISHEYFHTYNVKRLRPVELGPFDYEKPPTTASLWVAEGLTSYYGDLLIARAGLISPERFLAMLSGQIRELQGSPGRLKQSLAQSSLEVWTNSNSGVAVKENTVSYYVKGMVAGWVLDARVRAATDGQRSLDDVMRWAYRRYAAERGFTPEEFAAVASEVAGTDLSEWFGRVVGSAGEVDYTEALEWFGLRFRAPEGEPPVQTWTLEVRPDASGAQRERVAEWLGGRD